MGAVREGSMTGNSKLHVQGQIGNILGNALGHRGHIIHSHIFLCFTALYKCESHS